MKRVIVTIVSLLILCNLIGCSSNVHKMHYETNQKNQQTQSVGKKPLEVAEFEKENELDETEQESEPEPELESKLESKSKEIPLIQSLDFGFEDAVCLEKIAYAEAGGESIECMALVMLVVLNRAWSNEFPNSVEAVIMQDNQFTPVTNGSYYSAEPNEDTHKALNLILYGWNESQNALYFESYNGDSWHSRNLEYLYQCGNMKFYK